MRITALLVLVLGLLLSGCNVVYKQEIRQGNPLTEEMIAGLKSGMTKRQVRLLLGSPTISDSFHQDRWDYLYYVGKAGEPQPTPASLTLTFSNDQLVSATGALAPAALPVGGGSTAATPATAR